VVDVLGRCGELDSSGGGRRVDLYLVSPQHPLSPRLTLRVPFYNIIKSLVFVYLALPQSEVRHIFYRGRKADKKGASYIYRAHLAPFFQEHERDIDVFLASLRTRAGSAFAEGLTWLWTVIRTQLNVRRSIRLFAALI